MTRREWMLGAAAAWNAAPQRKILVVLIDGFGPEYLQASDMPNLKRLAAAGGLITGQGMIPSVTNVNNASLVTASWPAEHGITTNYYYDSKTGASQFMETSDFLLQPTLFERAGKAGYRTALVSAKEKIRTLISRGAGLAISAEKPDPAGIELGGPAPKFYSPESNLWCARAVRELFRRRQADLIYFTTTDYMMHTYPPEDERSLDHLHRLDQAIGAIVDDNPGLEISLTADHGMSAKTEAIDLEKVLAAAKIEAEAVPVIRDKHVVHHQNLGGACYIFLKRPEQAGEAAAVLRETKGIEEVHTREAAAREFHLMASRIGDFLVLGSKPVAFGALPVAREAIAIRSHGCRHESRVPMLWYGRKLDAAKLQYSFDLTRTLVFA